MRSIRLCFGLAMFFAVVSAQRVSGHTFTVDQEATPPFFPEIFYGGVGTGLSPGQEFVPQQSSLDVVELWINANSKSCYPTTVMVVVIRDQTLTGAVLGTSNPVTIACVAGVLHFDFPSPVPLIPGNTYVIQPIADDFNYWDMRIYGGIDVLRGGPRGLV